MNDRVMQFRVGVTVLATLLIAAILLLLFGGMPLFRRTYTIYIRFKEAPGVTVETPVRKSGIRIGRVTAVDFVEEGRAVRITAEIEAHRTIRHNEVCYARQTLLGDAYLQFARETEKPAEPPTPEKPAEPPAPVKPGETVQGEVGTSPLKAIVNLEESLSGGIKSVTTASEQLTDVADRIGTLLDENQETIKQIINQAATSMESMQTLVENANALIGDEQTREQLRSAIAELPDVLGEVQTTVGDLGSTLAAAERNLENLEGFTEVLGQEGGALFSEVRTSMDNLDKLSCELLKFSRALNRQEGSLGRLVHDPTLYRRLDRSAQNIQELTRRLEPVIDDVRIFTDKIARHPERLGVRGAIRRSPGVK